MFRVDAAEFCLVSPIKDKGGGCDFKVESLFRRKSCLPRVALTFSAMLACPASLLEEGKRLRVVTVVVVGDPLVWKSKRHKAELLFLQFISSVWQFLILESSLANSTDYPLQKLPVHS